MDIIKEYNEGRRDFSRANFIEANLYGADLSGADLYGANLSERFMRSRQIVPSGELIVFKKTTGGVVTLRIPAEAKRVGGLIGRKCRFQYAVVMSAPERAYSMHDGRTLYTDGATIYPDSFNDDMRIECSNGIHAFITREETEDYT